MPILNIFQMLLLFVQTKRSNTTLCSRVWICLCACLHRNCATLIFSSNLQIRGWTDIGLVWITNTLENINVMHNRLLACHSKPAIILLWATDSPSSHKATKGHSSLWQRMERVRGVEPLSRLWKSRVITVIRYPPSVAVATFSGQSPL